MDTIVERPGALDVHKAQVTACVRTPAAGGRREQHFAEFQTTVAGLLTLRDWLAAHGVTQVTMEATGVYWKPVWAILEDEFELLLVNARHVKNVPGRKTDVSDSAWLCQLAEAGLLRASFVPPKPIRALRNLTRYRKTQIQERAREANRLHKALEDTGIKLDCVASDILGVSGRAMLDALVSGTTDPAVLADLARGRLRAKLPALREALEGRFDRMHALWIGSILAHIDFLDEQIAGLTEMIAEQIVPFEQAVELLCTIPGVQRRTAEAIIAEIGIDMSVFPTAKELASWAGLCPGNHQSAGKRRSGRTRNGSKWLDWALEEAALAATRSKDTYLAAQYARLRPRRGHKKALGAVKHSIIVACWHMLSTGEIYNDLGGDYFQRRDPAKTTKRLVAQLERLGHTVTLQEAAAA
jgi:transposase